VGVWVCAETEANITHASIKIVSVSFFIIDFLLSGAISIAQMTVSNLYFAAQIRRICVLFENCLYYFNMLFYLTLKLSKIIYIDVLMLKAGDLRALAQMARVLQNRFITALPQSDLIFELIFAIQSKIYICGFERLTLNK
jgi:hypothetical protein